MVLAVAVVAAGAGYFGLTLSAPRLSGSPLTVGSADTAEHSPYSIGAALCLDRSGTVTVDRVSVTRAEGAIAVQAFAVGSLTHGTAGVQNSTLTGLGFAPGGTQHLPSTCYGPTAAAPEELGVQFTRTGDGSAAVHGLTVDYSWFGLPHSVQLPVDVFLCVKGDQLPDGCGN